ncbi:uncharacterized mitochondrial protein AtMg00860-like [Telopea speciosissima]|uniref:uncharacterized mitochondrial protein AtMg00860-like n=1 Tax=Telopea speciosissima TaxID=54955 RepID=UPI001CC4083D|nr:uncharacterized mitochondrial protein AtMg00860-like [Telopea speciosissima]
MEIMNRVFQDGLDKYVIVFVADILVDSKSEDEHVVHLRMVLQWLREKKLCAKYSKCEFWLSQLAFLGLVVSDEGIKVDPSKVKAVMKWEAPKNAGKIHSFLGLAGYYRCFIENFSYISAPMTQLNQKGVKSVWFEECKKSFQS